MTSYVRAPVNFMAHQRSTVGDQKISFTNFDHLGWLKCDGRAISRTTYALLFNVIGETFGVGDGSTTFNLPNYQGCVPGIAGKPSFSPLLNPVTYAVGSYGGEQQHTLTISEMPAHKHGSADVTENTNGDGQTGLAGGHTHTITDPGHTHTYVNQPNVASPATSLTTMDVADNENISQTTGSSTTGITINAVTDHQHTIGSTGGSQPHNNMQPTLFGGNMYIFSGRMYSGLGTYPFTSGTDLA